MNKSPYEELNKKDMILRDYLAIDRTEMSNENTLLAYVRTALTILITGVSLIKFFDILLLNLLGWVFVIIGIGVFIFGLYRFKITEDGMNKLKKY